MVILPFSLLTAFLALMLKLTLNLSAFVLALPMLYIFGCGLYTLYCREWTQFLILFVAEFGCFLLIVAGTALVEAVERFSEWLRFLYKGIIIKHNKTEPTYTKTSLFLCEKRRFFMARTEKGVVATI